MRHIGVYLTNKVNKELIIEEILSNQFLKEYIDLSNWHGELYSTITIDRMIDEELRHDRFLFRTPGNQSLQSMSSGQQRKALITYILTQKPQYIVLDDIYSSLDQATIAFLSRMLEELSQSTLLIQLFYRRTDVLPYVHTVYSVDHQNKIFAHQLLSQFDNASHRSIPGFNLNLPNLFTHSYLNIDPLVQLNGVSASYGEKLVLQDIFWTIRPGEFWQFVGPNGSGKSTLLSMIIGDNPKAYGQDMILFGRKTGSGESIWDIRKQIGYFTPTMLAQFSRDFSVEEMIISGLVDSIGLYSKPTDLQREIANSWLDVLGATYQNKKFNSLSFGQQRILLVVRAMVKHPPLLILDEPTVGLDDENIQLFIDLVKAIAAQHKLAIVYVSHRVEPQLIPDKIFELEPGICGSTGCMRIVSDSRISIE